MVSLRPATTGGYLGAYAVALVVGLASVPQSHDAASYWPATGVAALWLLRGRNAAQVALDSALVVVATTVAAALMGLPVLSALLTGCAHLVVGLVVRLGSSLTEGRLFASPLPRRVASKRDLWGVGLASVAAAVASAPFGLMGDYFDHREVDLSALALWLTRTTCSTFVITVAVLALLTTLMRAHARRGWAAKLTSGRRRFWLPELVVAVAVSLLATALLFGSTERVPIAFALMVSTTWIGYRFSPAVSGVYSMVFTSLAVLCTQAGRGPFGHIEDLVGRAIAAQSYAIVTTVLALGLSLAFAERASLIKRVVESEARASSRAELLDAVMNVMTDGLVVLEGSGEVSMRNQAAEAMMGPRREPGVDGPAHYGLHRVDGTPLTAQELPHVRALHGEVAPAEDILRIDPSTGQQSILSIGALPLRRSPSKGGTMAVVVIHDVTQERTHRRELEAFAGTVAHDLKAPLTGVGSWAEILGDQLDALDVDTTDPRASLRKIETSAARMEQLISDLLAYSRTSSGDLNPVSLSLSGLVEDVARELREGNITNPPLIEHGPLGQVRVDRTLIGQLLRNVIGNAVKYVAPGTRPHVVITSERIGSMLEVRVSDNGIGIPRHERGRIFDSFYRASSAGQYPGTGLGLAICARAVERHGGRISAREGLDGRGTTLVFTLPSDLEWNSRDGQDLGDTTKAEPPPRRTGSATAVS